MSQPLPEKMHFTRMDEGTDEDFQILKRVHERTLQELPDRLFGLLDGLGQDTAYNITRRDHCLRPAPCATARTRSTWSSPSCTTSAKCSGRSTTAR
jgi:hypothetical protein